MPSAGIDAEVDPHEPSGRVHAIATGPRARRPAAQARQDIADGLRRWEFWVVMGLQGVKRRYRRSLLGPLWLTISLAVLVAALSTLYGQLMNIPLERYAPHVALGFIAWQFISGLINESTTVFVRNKGWITNIPLPLSIFVFRMIWEHLITMAHNLLVYVGIALIFGINAGFTALLVLPGVFLLLLNSLWVGLLLGTVCARFRDVPQIVQSLVRVAFFVTPVIWMPEQLGTRAYIANFNPFAYFVQLIRDPLLGQVPSTLTWVLATAVTAIGCTTAAIVFTRFRARVPYWL